jgi:hypothetical protein
MRWFYCVIPLLMVLGFAQKEVTAASLRSLDFLVGVWTPERSGPEMETSSFQWEKWRGHTVLVGRHWTIKAGVIPGRGTESSTVAYYDTLSNEIRIHFFDKTRTLDFHLGTASENSLEFLSAGGPGQPICRLTYKLLPTDILSITLEEAILDREEPFSIVAVWSLHRR